MVTIKSYGAGPAGFEKKGLEGVSGEVKPGAGLGKRPYPTGNGEPLTQKLRSGLKSRGGSDYKEKKHLV